MLELVFSKYAQRFIKKNKSDKKLLNKIALQIKRLQENPTPNGAKKLVGYPFYRIRVQDYRIVYKYNKKELYVTIVERRDKVYSSLKNREI